MAGHISTTSLISYLVLWNFVVHIYCYEQEYELIGLSPHKEHSLMTPYQSLGMTIPYWDLFGSTIVTATHVRLTPDVQSRKGGLWNKFPVNFPNWEVNLHFKIHGKSKNLYGDGFAFWYLKSPLKSGSIFGSSNYFYGLAIFIDTYANQNSVYNHEFPYISVMVNNGSLYYDMENDGSNTTLAGCEAKVRGVQYDTHLSIRYEDDSLTVKTSVENANDWKECFSLKEVRLPTNGYIGVSASTGDLSDNHDIISIKVYELETKPSQLTENRDMIVPHAQHSNTNTKTTSKSSLSNFTIFLIIFLVIISIIFLSALLYLYWQLKNERNTKRFY